MRLYLICDNEDTAVGLRLAGVESTVVRSREEVSSLLEKAAQDPEIGIILINQTLFCHRQPSCSGHSVTPR